MHTMRALARYRTRPPTVFVTVMGLIAVDEILRVRRSVVTAAGADGPRRLSAPS